MAANGKLSFMTENQRLTALLENNEEVPYAMHSRTRTLPYVLPDSGFYANISQATGHDSFAGYSAELDLSVGYDFGRALEVERWLALSIS